MSVPPVSIGEVFTIDRKVTPAIYDAFVICSEDRNPLHVDDSYANERGFKGKLMHGAILNAFISGFVGTGLPSSDTMCLSQKVNFKRPFFLNDVVSMRARVEELQETAWPDKWSVAMKLTFCVTGKMVATGEVQFLIGR